MSYYLLVDFGSTFTKLTAVDTEKEEVLGTSSHFTTVNEDIRIGYHEALKKLSDAIDEPIIFDQIIACSSAAGGLKMAAIGLVEELTVEAAKRVCLGAGAKVDLVFSHHLTKSEIQQIIDQKIDIILIAGGTDGGNSENSLYNAKALGEAKIKIPIIYAGNKSIQDEIKSLFMQYEIDGYICENVMPRLNVLNVENAQNKIKEIFLHKIIEAKGIKKIEDEIDEVILPTPQAVLNAAELLSRGYLNEEGLGDIVVVDIGGATTDIYSMGNPLKRSDIIYHGLEETYAKRTVEGDLGMRYSALGIIDLLTKEEITFINEKFSLNLKEELIYRYHHVDTIPSTDKEIMVEEIMASICANKAMKRHAGQIKEIYTPMGMMYSQTGKDLSETKYVIGTGGVIIKAQNPQNILSSVLVNYKDLSELRPVEPSFLLDQDYLFSSMGLLCQKEPLLALKIMKKHLKNINVTEV